MLKTIAIAAALAVAPTAALATPVGSTYSFAALDGYGGDGSNVDLLEEADFGVTHVSAQALNVTGSSVDASYSGITDHEGYASTRYQYDAVSAKRVTFDSTGLLDSSGNGHAFIIMAAWQMNAAGDLLWVDQLQFDSCRTGCGIVGYASRFKSWTRLAAAGDSLFLTITASAYADAVGGTARGYVSRMVTIAGVPEPAAWALFVTGFGLVGFAARRRTVVAAAQ